MLAQFTQTRSIATGLHRDHAYCQIHLIRALSKGASIPRLLSGSSMKILLQTALPNWPLSDRHEYTMLVAVRTQMKKTGRCRGVRLLWDK